MKLFFASSQQQKITNFFFTKSGRKFLRKVDQKRPKNLLFYYYLTKTGNVPPSLLLGTIEYTHFIVIHRFLTQYKLSFMS